MNHLIATDGNGSFTHPALPLMQTLWDSTSLGTLKECPMKYFYQVICGLQSNKPKDPLVFGIAFHRAMQIYHYRRAAGDHHDGALEGAIEAGIASYVDEHGHLYQAVKKERGFYALLRAIVWHLDTFNDRGYKDDVAETIILDNGKPAAELSFRFHFFQDEDEIDYYLCGHFDRLARFNGQNFVQDYKTTSGLGQNFFDGFNPDNQVLLYTLAGKIVLNQPVAGVIIDGVQCAVHFNRFQRGFITIPRTNLDEFIEDTKMWIQLAKLFASQGHYPRNEKSCDKYGGCPYREICKSPASVRDNVIETQFHVRVWDPSIDRDEEAA